jgi:protein SCO1
MGSCALGKTREVSSHCKIMKPDASSTPPVGGDFNLIDHDGQPVSRSTYAGKYVLMFFGFTHCRVVCPRALTRITAALDLLGDLASRIEPLYISVDPERDTPHVMKAFLASQFPRFTGLTGPRTSIDAVKSAYRVYAQKASAIDEPDGYVMPHTALTYMLDTGGRYLTHFPDTIDATTLADRIRAAVLCS